MNKDLIYNNLIGFIAAMEVAEMFSSDKIKNKKKADEARDYAHRFAYGN